MIYARPGEFSKKGEKAMPETIVRELYELTSDEVPLKGKLVASLSLALPMSPESADDYLRSYLLEIKRLAKGRITLPTTAVRHMVLSDETATEEKTVLLMHDLYFLAMQLAVVGKAHLTQMCAALKIAALVESPGIMRWLHDNSDKTTIPAEWSCLPEEVPET